MRLRVLLLLCSASALSVFPFRRSAARRSGDLAAFDSWWRLRGADGAVAWSADAGGAGVRGGLATRDLSPGEVVLTVPLSLVLAVPLDDRAGTDSRGLWMAPDERLAARLLAARDAAREARPHGDASVGHLGPWIDVLPTARAFRRQLPQHWGVRKLRALDQGAPEVASDAREIAAYRRMRRAQLRDHVRLRRRGGARDTAALRTDLLERAARADGDSWQWALDVVGTRGGTVTIAGTEAFALVPGVEMLNHDPRLPPEGTRCDIVWPDSRAPPPVGRASPVPHTVSRCPVVLCRAPIACCARFSSARARRSKLSPSSFASHHIFIPGAHLLILPATMAPRHRNLRCADTVCSLVKPG